MSNTLTAIYLSGTQLLGTVILLVSTNGVLLHNRITPNYLTFCLVFPNRIQSQRYLKGVVIKINL